MAAKARGLRCDGPSLTEKAHALRLLVKEKLQSKRKGGDSDRATMYKLFDTDSGVPVDIGKFSMCVEKFCPGLTDFEVKLLFDYLDTDRSKSLSRPELGERLLAEPAERFPTPTQREPEVEKRERKPVRQYPSPADILNFLDSIREHDLDRSLQMMDEGLVHVGVRNTKSGRGVLHVAAESGNSVIISELLERTTAEHTLELDARDLNQMTPLHVAAAAGEDDVLRILARLGADLEAREENGRTPLMVCAWYANVERKDEDGKILPLPVKPGREKPPHCIPALKALCEAGANLDAVDFEGRTALHLAAMRERTEAIRVLLAAGASTSIRDENGRSALHCGVVAEGHPENIEGLVLLVKAGSSLLAEDNFKESPMDKVTSFLGFDADAIALLEGLAAEERVRERERLSKMPKSKRKYV